MSQFCSLCEEVKPVADEFNPVVSALALAFLFHPIRSCHRPTRASNAFSAYPIVMPIGS